MKCLKNKKFMAKQAEEAEQGRRKGKSSTTQVVFYVSQFIFGTHFYVHSTQNRILTEESNCEPDVAGDLDDQNDLLEAELLKNPNLENTPLDDKVEEQNDVD
jgi:hypothetical protein